LVLALCLGFGFQSYAGFSFSVKPRHSIFAPAAAPTTALQLQLLALQQQFNTQSRKLDLVNQAKNLVNGNALDKVDLMCLELEAVSRIEKLPYIKDGPSDTLADLPNWTVHVMSFLPPPISSTNPPVGTAAQLQAQISSLEIQVTIQEQQLLEIQASANNPSQIVNDAWWQSQVDWAAWTMASVAQTLALPVSTPISNLPAWAASVMLRLPPNTKL